MPIKRVQFPDGSIKRIEVPEGATNEQIIAFVQSQHSTAPAQPKEWQPRQRSLTDLQQAAREHDSTDGMNFGQKFAAGAGKSLVDTARGLGQLWDYATGDDEGLAESFAEQDRIDRRDGSLMGSGAGLIGNITGNVAQVLSPGVVLKAASKVPMFARGATALNTASRASLPTTIKGAAAQGAALGFIQPVGTEGSRVANTAIGGGAGAAGAAIPRGLGALYRGTGSYLGKVTPAGAERRAARILLAEAENPAALSTPQPSAIPGVQRTLAEETLDPGIARLERNARSTGRGFDTLDRTNNAARVSAIRKFAGDESAVETAKAQRATASNTLRRDAMKIEGVDTNRLISQIKRMERAQEGRPAVASGLGQLRALLTREIPDAERTKAAIGPLQAFITADRTSATNREAAKEAIKQIRAGEWPTVAFGSGQAGTRGVGASYDAAKDALAASRKALEKTHTGHDKVAVLDNVRKTIGDMLSGKYGGDSAAALAGSRELMAVKNQLDRVLAKQAPEYGQYLDAFRSGSKPINRMEIGQSLIGQKSGSAVLDPVTGEQVLLPASFSSRARNLDKVAAEATGFRKAKAADYLQPQDLKTIAGVQDDLQRKAFAATAGSGGNSQTFERMALNDRVAGGFASRMPIVGRVAEYLGQIGETRLQAKLGEMLADPSKARAILAGLPAHDRRLIEDAMARIGTTMGVTALPAVE